MNRQGCDLAFIQTTADPLDLFKEWYEEVKRHEKLFLRTHTMTLASATKEGKPANRTVVLKNIVEDGFIFNTTKEGRKYKEFTDNPEVAAVFLWCYKIDGTLFARQVRIEGKVEELAEEVSKEYYDKEPFFAVVRSHVVHQGEVIEWDALKQRMDKWLDDFHNKKIENQMPWHYTTYKIIPERLEFYYAWGGKIGDVIEYTKKDGASWQCNHIGS